MYEKRRKSLVVLKSVIMNITMLFSRFSAIITLYIATFAGALGVKGRMNKNEIILTRI